MERLLFTSESVTEGHPDKVCDFIADTILDAYLEKEARLKQLQEKLRSTVYSLDAPDVREYLSSLGYGDQGHIGENGLDLVKRPGVTSLGLMNLIHEEADSRLCEKNDIEIKYKGYIEREQMVADKMLRLENIKIQGKFDYANMNQITIEARQKLAAINPETLAQASRIPGVSPSDINVMLVLLGR